MKIKSETRKRLLKHLLDFKDLPFEITMPQLAEAAAYLVEPPGYCNAVYMAMAKFQKWQLIDFDYNDKRYTINSINYDSIQSAIGVTDGEKVKDIPTRETTEPEIEEKVEEIGDAELIPYIKGHAYDARQEQVMIDANIGDIYGVATSEINRARSNNPTKFVDPETGRPFAFQLTDNETKEVMQNLNNLSGSLKFRPSNPWVYTLEGINMLATILKSEKATLRVIQIVKVFSDLERMAHGEEPKQPGFAEMMQVLIEQNKMSNDNIAQLSNSISLQGQQLTGGIVATNIRIDTEINPAIERLKDEAKQVKETRELLNRRIVEHEAKAELERRRVKAMGIQQKIGDLVRAEIKLKNKQYWEIWKPHNARYGYKHSRDMLPYDKALHILEEVKDRIRGYLNIYPEFISRLFDEERSLFAEHGLWGNFPNVASSTLKRITC